MRQRSLIQNPSRPRLFRNACSRARLYPVKAHPFPFDAQAKLVMKAFMKATGERLDQARRQVGAEGGTDGNAGEIDASVLGALRVLSCTGAGGVSFFPIADRTAKRIRSVINRDGDFLRISIALI